MTKPASFHKMMFFAGLGAALAAHLGARFGNAGGGVPSPVDAPAGDIAGYYAGYGGFNAVSSYLYTLAAIALIVFAAGVRRRIVGASGSSQTRSWAVTGVLGAGLYAVMLMLVALLQLALVGLAQRPSADSETIAALAFLWVIAVALLVPASVPLLLGFGLAGRRSGAFSRLVSNFALIGAGLGLVPPPEVLGPLSPAAGTIGFVLSQFQPWMLVLWLIGAAFTIQRPLAPGERLAEKPAEAGEG